MDESEATPSVSSIRNVFCLRFSKIQPRSRKKSLNLGIIIAMFFNDHNPPYFHARYAGEKVAIEIESLQIIEGHISPRAL